MGRKSPTNSAEEAIFLKYISDAFTEKFNALQGDKHSAPVPLTEPELDARRAELRRLSSTSLPWRALYYLLGCWACQTFWTVAAVFAITRGLDEARRLALHCCGLLRRSRADQPTTTTGSAST